MKDSTSNSTRDSLQPPSLPFEIWERIIQHHSPSREDYAVRLPWKRSAKSSTVVSLTQVNSTMRQIALPLVWAVVYVETMKDWGILWKRISRESGQHIHSFLQFWAIARLPHLCMDNLQKMNNDLLWYAFVDRRKSSLCDGTPDESVCHDKLGNGPDGHGADAIIKSREVFLQATKDISSTWSKRLNVIYWDATTTFPEGITSNIRRIQEYIGDSDDDGISSLPGLEYLWIDYIEGTTEEAYDLASYGVEHARRITFFNDTVWSLGRKTLQKLKFFSLAPPFWPNTRAPLKNLAKISPSRLQWSKFNDGGYGKLQKQLNEYDPETGPGQFFKIVQMIHPEIFFTSSQTPFHCKDLLPCWARLRCIHVFNMVLLTNDDATRKLFLPGSAEVFHATKMPDSEYWLAASNYKMMAKDSDTGAFLRGAIQLRPVLESLRREKGRPLTGKDITIKFTSLLSLSHETTTTSTTAQRNGDEEQENGVRWTEDWTYSISCCEGFKNLPQFKEADHSRRRYAKGLSSAYIEWLQDPDLAEKVAQAFNQGVREYGDGSKGPYPFCHSEYAGQVYFEPSACKTMCQDGKVWLDRPRHRGCYSNLSIEGLEKKRKVKKARRYSPYDYHTLHPHMEHFPSYRPSI